MPAIVIITRIVDSPPLKPTPEVLVTALIDASVAFPPLALKATPKSLELTGELPNKSPYTPSLNSTSMQVLSNVSVPRVIVGLVVSLGGCGVGVDTVRGACPPPINPPSPPEGTVGTIVDVGFGASVLVGLGDEVGNLGGVGLSIIVGDDSGVSIGDGIEVGVGVGVGVGTITLFIDGVMIGVGEGVDSFDPWQPDNIGTASITTSRPAIVFNCRFSIFVILCIP
ncbi:hypothetical protein ACFLU3_01375 [Chloroflexota bacterium]